MIRRLASSLLLFFSCAGALVAANDAAPVIKLANLDAKEAGRALAEKLRSAAPAENAAFHGLLKASRRQDGSPRHRLQNHRGRDEVAGHLRNHRQGK